MHEPLDVAQTRLAYDTVAENYAEYAEGEMARQPFDRSMLQVFADLIRENVAGGRTVTRVAGTPVAGERDAGGRVAGRRDAGGRVVEVGCGPGRISAHLHGLGLDMFGIDLSPGMVRIARRTHPGLRFEVGDMASIDVPDGSLAGVVAWYSIIHTPPERLPRIFDEFARVLGPAGRVLLAFQVGDEPKYLDHAYGHDISAVAYRLRPEHIESLLVGTGFDITARLVRAPVEPEYTPQAYLIAQKPG